MELLRWIQFLISVTLYQRQPQEGITWPQEISKEVVEDFARRLTVRFSEEFPPEIPLPEFMTENGGYSMTEGVLKGVSDIAAVDGEAHGLYDPRGILVDYSMAFPTPTPEYTMTNTETGDRVRLIYDLPSALTTISLNQTHEQSHARLTIRKYDWGVVAPEDRYTVHVLGKESQMIAPLTLQEVYGIRGTPNQVEVMERVEEELKKTIEKVYGKWNDVDLRELLDQESV